MVRKSSIPTVSGNHQGDEATAAGLDFDPAQLEQRIPETPPPAVESSTPAPDPFAPDSLRLTQDFSAAAGVKKALLTVPVRKPEKSWFVRAHPDPKYRLQTAVIELKEDREVYLVARSLWEELATEVTFKPKLFATAINRQGVLFLWDLNLPGKDDRVNHWTRSALEALDLATRGWIRIAANLPLGAYDVYQASDQLSEPDWPDVPFPELLRTAFKDRRIDDLNHPVLRKLRGEV
jgi:hypothetical protein